MDTNEAYVSEFEKFMNGFLDQHPEIIEDQRQGRLIHWDHHVDLAAQEKAAQDSVPEDGYGFYYPAWRRQSAEQAPAGSRDKR